jgi:hypothetical protein
LAIFFSTFCLAFSLSATAQETAAAEIEPGDPAAIAAIIKGVGDFTWNQSQEEVAATLGDSAIALC